MITALQERITNALTEARQLSQEHNPKAAAAWDEVEELFAESSHQQQENTNFQQYCQEHPEADECRIYDV